MKLTQILWTVFLDKSRQATTSSRSFLMRTTSAAATATSVPLPMATPTSASARAAIGKTVRATSGMRASDQVG